MTDPNRFTSAAEQQADHWLKQIFEPAPALSAGFEDRVMTRVRAAHHKTRNHRWVFTIMALYWAAASLAGSWLLLGNTSLNAARGSLSVILLLTVLGMTGAGIYLLVRQASLRMSDLFFRTIR